MALSTTIEIEQGASNVIPFTVTRDGAPLDLANVEVLVAFRTKRESTGQLVYSGSKTGGNVVVTGLGAGEIRITPAESRAFRVDVEGDIDLVISETDRPRFWSGTARVRRTVLAS